MVKCCGCKKELDRSMFGTIVNGNNTGKELYQCSDRTVELVKKRGNVQLYCRQCQSKYRMKNIGKYQGYYRKFRNKQIQSKMRILDEQHTG